MDQAVTAAVVVVTTEAARVHKGITVLMGLCLDRRKMKRLRLIDILIKQS